MKTTSLFLFVLALLFSVWSCNDSSKELATMENQDLSLEQSLKSASADIGHALNSISKSKGYEILTLNEEGLKSAEEDEDDSVIMSITIEDLKGVYEYDPVPVDTISNRWGESIKYNYFTNTADDDLFIINLPEEKATRPRDLYTVSEEDDALENNFSIITSDFGYYDYDGSFSYSYLLNSKVELNGEFIASINIDKVINSRTEYNYNIDYEFDDGYLVSASYEYGDTSRYAYALSEGDEVLYEENISYTAQEGALRSKTVEHSLLIGQIEIVRKRAPGEETEYTIYYEGTLQENAIVEHISNNSGEGLVFCKRERDLKITLDDGTEILLSELTSDYHDTMSELFGSVLNVYFVTNTINKLAWQIYNEQSE